MRLLLTATFLHIVPGNVPAFAGTIPCSTSYAEDGTRAVLFDETLYTNLANRAAPEPDEDNLLASVALPQRRVSSSWRTSIQ